MNTSFEPQGFGRYVLVDKIAVGGMAEVFKAKSYSEGGFEKLLVIKRILHHLSENEEFVEMFIDEAKISVELQHPNIVQIFDFGKFGDNWYIAMELVEGKDTKGMLRRLAKRRKLMPSEFAVLIAHEMCKGLDYAHKKADLRGNPLDIIHRDISPSNIIVSYRGQVKVADFGIAKAQKSTYTTKDGVLKGKFEYMSPEQARGERVTPQSDVFACGIILHEMLTGRRLFKTDSDVGTLEKIKSGDYPKPSEVNPQVPASLDTIVMRALTVQPSDRFRDAREMQAALLEELYPQTPDVVQERLRRFMEELFAEDISAERDRLEASSVKAEVLKQEVIESDSAWVPPATSATAVQPAPPPSRMPLALAGAAVVLLAALVVFLAMREPETRIVEVQAANTVATTGTLQLLIGPEGARPTVFLDDQPISEDTLRVLSDDIPPGVEHTLRVEAEGYEPHTDTLQVAAGERFRLRIALVPRADKPEPADAALEVVERPTPPAGDPSPAEPPPVAVDAAVAFTSSPAGAEVVVNGRSVGRTPTTWNGAQAGKSYKVVYRMSGYASSSTKVRVPKDGGTVPASASLKAEKVDPGELFVNVKGGWGEVWIDGRRVDTTPLKHQLPAGTYKVKVVNTEAGFEESRTVTIVPGKTQKLMFSL